MDKKDEIILQQLDVIRTMTQNSLNRMGSDFWGAPLTPDAPRSAAPKANAPGRTDGAKPEKARTRRKKRKRRFPRRRRSKISRRSWTATLDSARSSAR